MVPPRGRSLLLLAVALAAGCGTPPPPAEPTEEGGVDTPRLVATERGTQGGRLVALGEDGERIDELTTVEPGAPPVRDTAAAFSPDGAWIVFASSRGRAQIGESSLWIVEARLGAPPRRLTTSDSTDMDPVFTRDGKHLLYSSIPRRGGDNLDLWRVGIDLHAPGGPALRGAPEPLTRTPENELHPSAGPGDAIAYTLASDAGSSIWVLEQGARRQLTHGEGDVTPSWSPDGRQIAFASGRELDLGPKVGTRVHTDLFLVGAAGGEPRLVLENPHADEIGPRWSKDGRYLFATSVVRALTKPFAPLLTTVVFVDLRERPVSLRALYRPGGEEQRSSPAVGDAVLDASVLHQNLLYQEAACESLKRLLQRRLWQQSCDEHREKYGPKFVCPPFESLPEWSRVCNFPEE